MKADELMAAIIATVLAGLAVAVLYYFVSFVWENIWWIIGTLVVVGGGGFLIIQQSRRTPS
jgi:hypothetical protein